MKFDVGRAIELSNENRDPVKVAELEKLVGHEVVALESRTNRINRGILKEIGPTFHPRVPAYLYVPDNTRQKYSKGWLGWKFEDEYATNSLQNIPLIFSEGNYYAVHVGKIVGHEQESSSEQSACGNCLIARADEWIKLHQKETSGFNDLSAATEREAVKFVLKNYPEQIAKKFGAEIIEDLTKLVKKL